MSLLPGNNVGRLRGRGFTLIEVLVTVGIIVVLTGLTLVGVLAAKKKGVEVRIRSDLALIGTALEAYKNDFGDYPRFDDDNTPNSLNMQMDRGARMLCRALLSPGPAAVVGGGNTGFNASANGQGPDGADGPGFRVRTANAGKIYGPYLDSSKFKLGNPAAPVSGTTGLPGWDSTYFTDATILDMNGNSILYYPAATAGSPANLYVQSVPPVGVGVATVRPVYNAYDNFAYGSSAPSTSSAYILSDKQLQFILGDLNCNGVADAGETPTTTLPYLLWTAGADGHYGFGLDASGKPLDPTATAVGLLKTDDITNFDIPANLEEIEDVHIERVNGVTSFSSARRARGYTLVELFLTLAVLMILLGLMINLSNRVRRESADRLTRQLLARLTGLMGDYQKTYNQLPGVQPLVQPGVAANEPGLQVLARQNNIDFVRGLNVAALIRADPSPNDPLTQSYRSVAGGGNLLIDPWGSPIIFMPQQNPLIGMAPGDASFFMSAGPDRAYLTREDNVYSYEGNEEK